MFSYGQRSKCADLPNSYHLTFVTIQYLHSYAQNLFQISFADGIFAFQPMFSYGQRSKCADLLNSYYNLNFFVFSSAGVNSTQ